MNRLDELLEKWRNGMLTDSGLAELNCLLETPEARSRLHDVAQFDAALLEGLRKTPWLELAETVRSNVFGDDTRTPAPSKVRAFGSRMTELRHWLLPLAACFAVAAGVMVWFSGRPVLRLEVLHGEVSVLRCGKVIPAGAGLNLHAGDVVRTASDAGARVQWIHEATRLELQSGTETCLDAVKGGKHITLMSGSLIAQVARQEVWHPMILETPYGRLEVLGTRFELQVAGNRMRVIMSKGRVLLAGENRNDALEVQAGQSGELDAFGKAEVKNLSMEEALGLGLLAHWPLSEGKGNLAYDVSGNGLDAEIQNPVWTSQAGRSVLAFASSSKTYLPLSQRSFLRSPELFLPPAFTITLWFRADSTGHVLQSICGNSDFGTDIDGFSLILNCPPQKTAASPLPDDPSLAFRAGDGKRRSGVHSPSLTLTYGSWHFLALAVNQAGGCADIYLDGVKVNRRGIIGKKFSLKSPLFFGAAPGRAGLQYIGDMRDIRIYDRLLGPKEIHLLSNP